MPRGKHARAVLAVRAWRLAASPPVIVRMAEALLLALAVAAGSLAVLSAERGSWPGLAAAVLLGALVTTAMAV